MVRITVTLVKDVFSGLEDMLDLRVRTRDLGVVRGSRLPGHLPMLSRRAIYSTYYTGYSTSYLR